MSDKVFHVCMKKNNDGTNRIIGKNFTCFYPTNMPFWKTARDINFCVRRRSQEARQDVVKRQDFNRYCRYRGREDIRRWMSADVSEVYFLKENDRFLLKDNTFD